jgi:hypothetical protein
MADNAFSSLKKSRTTDLNKIAQQAEQMNSNGQRGDDRFWTPTRDKAGNGFAIIRFLPRHQDEDVPFVRIWEHAFKGPGGWYIEKSLTTLGRPDPVSEMNQELWATNNEDNKKIASQRKRKLQFISNIYVIRDPGKPENEGKVFLYKYGKKIFDKINMLMHPPFEGEDPINPFDFWDGCNFRMKITLERTGPNSFPNYDLSTWDAVSPLLNGDEKALEAVWKQQYALNEFTDPKNYKSYDDLKARLNTVLKLNSVGKQTTTQVTQRPAEKQNDIPPWVQEGDAVIDGDDVPSSNNGVDETIDDIQSFLNSFENDNN